MPDSNRLEYLGNNLIIIIEFLLADVGSHSISAGPSLINASHWMLMIIVILLIVIVMDRMSLKSLVVCAVVVVVVVLLLLFQVMLLANSTQAHHKPWLLISPNYGHLMLMRKSSFATSNPHFDSQLLEADTILGCNIVSTDQSDLVPKVFITRNKIQHMP